jgi:hypothetical protein
LQNGEATLKFQGEHNLLIHEFKEDLEKRYGNVGPEETGFLRERRRMVARLVR